MAKVNDDELREEAIKLGLVAVLAQIKKARKASAELHAPIEYFHHLEGAVKAELDSRGWEAPPKKGKKEKDQRQLEIPGASGKRGTKKPSAATPAPGGRVKCSACPTTFAVPEGDHLRKCPDCKTVVRAKSASGELIHAKVLVQPPDDILALMQRTKMKGTQASLLPKDKRKLETWIKENPDHLTNGETVLAGDRVADPAIVGSGNPLTLICDSYIGNGCNGYETFDTPGSSTCPSCGAKWTVGAEIVGDTMRVLVRPFDAAVDDPKP